MSYLYHLVETFRSSDIQRPLDCALYQLLSPTFLLIWNHISLTPMPVFNMGMASTLHSARREHRDATVAEHDCWPPVQCHVLLTTPSSSDNVILLLVMVIGQRWALWTAWFIPVSNKKNEKCICDLLWLIMPRQFSMLHVISCCKRACGSSLSLLRCWVLHIISGLFSVEFSRDLDRQLNFPIPLVYSRNTTSLEYFIVVECLSLGGRQSCAQRMVTLYPLERLESQWKGACNRVFRAQASGIKSSEVRSRGLRGLEEANMIKLQNSRMKMLTNANAKDLDIIIHHTASNLRQHKATPGNDHAF